MTPDPLLALGDDALGARLARAAALPDAPPAWQQRALAAWRAPAAGPSALAQAVEAGRRFLASLAFDSWAQAPLAAGLRSAAASPTRQLVFSTEGRDVDLRIAPAAPGYTVSGQILGPEESGTAVLRPAGAPAGTDASSALQATVDPLGEFRLAAVAPGRYELRLLLGRDELVLPPFEVGTAPEGQRAG
ncbi:MAG: hypothetical protein U1F53_23020 [Burkholderiaceae bacterium]